MAYRIKYYLPVLVYILVILGMSSLNQNVVASITWGIEDFILHTVEYNILGVLLIWAFFRDKAPIELKSSYRLAVGVGLLIGMADEIYQSFVPTRFSTIEDVVADGFGVILSIITFNLLMKINWLERFRTHA